MENVRARDGLVCICVECKKIIRTVGDCDPADAPLVSHGICPACAAKLYGTLARQEPLST